MPYTKTTWIQGSTPAINATNLNKIEDGVATAQTTGESALIAAQAAQDSANSNTAAIASKVKTVTTGLQIDAGPIANRPAPGNVGRIWIATS